MPSAFMVTANIEQVEKRRIARRLTYTDVAQRAGRSTRCVHLFFKGKPVGAGSARAISMALGIDDDRLIADDAGPTGHPLAAAC